jgi:hypothetical protein
MRLVRLACLLLLAAPPAAHAAVASITSREVPLGPSRAPAALTSVAAFDMVGFHWRGTGSVRFRTRSADGRWSAWHQAAPESEDLPDVGSERSHTGWRLGNPWWTGPSNRLEVRTSGTVRRVRAWFVRSSSIRVPLRHVSIAGSPQITTRRAWGANEKIVRAAPRYAPQLRLAIVHHTAGSNAYGPADSAAIVKGIELYHVKANGWNDIGYNFLVDRFGQVFEGRGGGVDRNVIGAHAEGFNTGSVGIALIGTYSSRAPSAAAERAIASLLSWRLDVAHVDPASSSMITSGGSPKFRAGQGVYLRAVSGHRDAGFTSCPGDKLYARLGALTEVAATTGLPKLYEPVVRGAIGSTVRFSARLSQLLEWRVTVTGPDGKRVASRAGTGDRVSWAWNSSSAARNRRYTWAIQAGDVRSATGALGASRTPPSPPLPPPPAPVPGPPPASGLRVGPTVVSPNEDGYADTASVRYTLAEPSTVTITLVDSLGLTVLAARLGARQKAGARTVQIDPSVVPDGQYSVVLSATGERGGTSRLTVDLAVNRTLGWLRADPPSLDLSPTGNSLVTVSFELTTPAMITVEIRDHGAQLGILFGQWLESGSHAVLWSGVLPSGPIAPGLYDVWVTAGTDAGTVSQRVPITVTAGY